MKILYVLLLLVIITACGRNKNPQALQQVRLVSGKMFVVQEVIQTAKYTYLKVSEEQSERWVAVAKLEAMAGDRYYYDQVHQMKNFHSKELNKDFETVDFINKISKSPLSAEIPVAVAHGHKGKVGVPKNTAVSVQKSVSELTVSQIYADPKNYEDKEVMIMGEVVKVNENIMGKNWIHIQDGTDYNNRFDLPITSSHMPPMNQVVSFRGIIRLNKDFGSGYFYDVIVEDAVMLTQ